MNNLLQNIKQISDTALLSTILNSPISIVITNKMGIIEYVNPKFEQITGYTAGEVIGKNPRILQSGETPTEIYVNLWQTLLLGNEWRGRFTNRKKNGEIFFELAQISPILDEKGNIVYIVAIKEDITERVTLEKFNKHLSEELTIILDTLPAWVFYKDTDNRFLRVNQMFADVMQMTKMQLEGASCFDLFPREQAESYLKDDKEVINSGIAKAKYIESVTLVDGLHWVETEKIPLRDEKNEIIGILGFTIDITERKKLEDEVHQLSITDELTGLNNRRGFLIHSNEILKIAKRLKLPCMILFADMDNLKEINDCFGHISGDNAIIEVAQIFDDVFRDSDAISRMGGDEFAVLALNVTSIVGKNLLSRLDSAIAERNTSSNFEFSLSVSYGVVFFEPDKSTILTDLISNADDLMFIQKCNKKKATKINTIE
ncbi:MAG: PAS domain S-box protein [Ignavibacteria bacterium]|nr:PAS domain S-box protein [Ignavibacteria bacterium]